MATPVYPHDPNYYPPAQQQAYSYTPSQAPPSYVPQPPPPMPGGYPQYATVPEPVKAPAAPAQPAQWKTGLCGCFEDGYVCCLGLCMMPCLYGENARKVTGSGCCGSCCLMYLCRPCSCLFAAPVRQQMRAKYGLPEDPCNDCLVTWCCMECAACQENREMRIREGWKTWMD